MRFIIEIPDEFAQRSASATESLSGALTAQTIYAASNALSGGAGPGATAEGNASRSPFQGDSVSGGAAESERTELGALVSEADRNDGGAAPVAG